MITSYSSPVNLGHKDSKEFFNGGQYVVQEKVDGSQFSFGVYENGLECRSHGSQIDLNNIPKMFLAAVTTAIALTQSLHKGWTYRGEALANRRHNILTYDRVPVGNIILYDIDRGGEDYLQGDDLYLEAKHLRLEVVPDIDYAEGIPTAEQLEKWLATTSILGGTLVEGVVLKNYRVIGRDGKVLMVKYVSDKFKEFKNKPTTSQTDILADILVNFVSEARWQKAVQHLSEMDSLKGEGSDIGPLLKEISRDFEDECANTIKDLLWEYYRKTILKAVCQGFPEWYKQRLVDDLYAE